MLVASQANASEKSTDTIIIKNALKRRREEKRGKKRGREVNMVPISPLSQTLIAYLSNNT